ncbi:MAG: hypothetical protein ACFWTY_07720 [Shouchella clausii]
MGFEDNTRNATVSINTIHLHYTASFPLLNLDSIFNNTLKIKTISLCLKRLFSIYCGY